jgi:hypothetical protein
MSPVNAEITASLERAFDRISDFEAVQAGRSAEQMLEAVERLQEAVGIGCDTRVLIRDRLDQIAGSARAPGHVLLGMIVGLLAAEFSAEQ